MKQVLFLTPEDAVPGFALAGVRQQVADGDSFWPALEAACADPTIGVIAADVRLLETAGTERLHRLTRHWPGVLVTLPAPASTARPPEDELQRLVRRALGYHVRLE